MPSSKITVSISRTSTNIELVNYKYYQYNSETGEIKQPMNRRKVLKRLGVSTAISTAGLPAVTGAEEEKNRKLVGVTYNPTTMEVTGTGTAIVAGPVQNLTGVLKLNEATTGVEATTIPIDLSDPVRSSRLSEQPNVTQTNRFADYTITKKGKFKREGKPMRLRVTPVEAGGISGVIEHPKGDFDAGAFQFEPIRVGETEKSVIRKLREHIQSRKLATSEAITSEEAKR